MVSRVDSEHFADEFVAALAALCKQHGYRSIEVSIQSAGEGGSVEYRALGPKGYLVGPIVHGSLPFPGETSPTPAQALASWPHTQAEPVVR